MADKHGTAIENFGTLLKLSSDFLLDFFPKLLVFVSQVEPMHSQFWTS